MLDGNNKLSGFQRFVMDTSPRVLDFPEGAPYAIRVGETPLDALVRFAGKHPDGGRFVRRNGRIVELNKKKHRADIVRANRARR